MEQQPHLTVINDATKLFHNNRTDMDLKEATDKDCRTTNKINDLFTSLTAPNDAAAPCYQASLCSALSPAQLKPTSFRIMLSFL